VEEESTRPTGLVQSSSTVKRATFLKALKSVCAHKDIYRIVYEEDNCATAPMQMVAVVANG